jgi:hypothetical protein
MIHHCSQTLAARLTVAATVYGKWLRPDDEMRERVDAL